ncbi:MAG: hypothetical protein COY66_05100 [Candidatus Kerfeldbacteria bacterium CG_4_10_14_0_8_um_filter_42_10]|uniref:Tyr recombinase domain-containing protein n=1 Tax=Candidatus Kerfeldbacteria bacterium CG_4_10_14_0_8_um_filter_42_10 TaxID=2014248 RepID=A0A2M7RHR5_9BACT|nr:MAG: hypothetical protein COY66_05100 [Candidatus Kerfeldbacteria bacterium CG_4_10_14_0_8_um_filter_42_10]
MCLRTPQEPGALCYTTMKLKEAIEEFKNWREFKVKASTVKGYDRELRTFCLFLRNPEIENIMFKDVMEYLNGKYELGWNENTFLPITMSLKKFFDFAQLQGWASFNPKLIPVPKQKYTMPRIITEDNYQKLLSIIPRNNDPRHIRNLAFITMLWDTGARNGEIVSLNTDNLDTGYCRAIVRTEKSQGRRPFRELFWTESTNENLKHWLEKREYLKRTITFREPNALFISICGSIHDTQGRRLQIKGVGEFLRRYSNRAGIPYQNAHSFRHHKGHELAGKGANNSTISSILGHSSLQSSMVYTNMFGKELEELYHKYCGY